MKFVNRKAWAIAFLIFCYLRLAGQALYGILLGESPPPEDPWFAPVYFVPLAIYEVIGLFAVTRLTLGINKAITIQFSFFIGYAFFNVIDEVFFRPTHFDVNEYIGFLVGAISLTYSLYKHARTQRINP